MHYYKEYQEPGLIQGHRLDSFSLKSIAAELAASLRDGEIVRLGAVDLPPIPTEFPPLPDLKLPDYKKVPQRTSLLLRTQPRVFRWTNMSVWKMPALPGLQVVLPNGLRVLLLEDHELGLVRRDVWPTHIHADGKLHQFIPQTPFAPHLLHMHPCCTAIPTLSAYLQTACIPL